MSERCSSRERVLVAAAGAAFLYAVLFRGAIPIYLFATNEGGVWLDEGYAVLRGQVMYRDFFDFVGPGVVHFNAAVMAALGPTAAAANRGAVLLAASLAAAVHALAARVCARGFRLLPPALVLVLAYAPLNLGSHKWPSLVCATLALLALTSGAGHRASGAAAGGALLAASALCTQDVGAGVAAAVVLTRLLEGPAARRSLIYVLAGMAAVAVPVLAWFAMRAGWRELLFDLVVFPLTRYSNRAGTFRGLLTWGPTAAAQLAVCAGGVAAAIMALGDGARPAERVIAAAGLGVLAASLHRTLPNVYPQGLAIGSTLLTVPLACALGRAWARRPARWVHALAGAAILPGLAWGSLGLIARRQAGALTRETHRAGEVWLAQPMPELRWIEERAAPDEPLFVLPLRGGVFFLTHTRAAGSFHYLVDGPPFHTDDQLRRAAAGIERARPRYGVWEGDVRQSRLTAVRTVIERDYVGETLANGVTVFRHSVCLKPSGCPDVNR